MYVNKTYVNLATTASASHNNLALYHSQDLQVLASTLAVMQDGYVNVIPILSTTKRAKYIPITQEERGAGVVKEVAWVELAARPFFVVLSTHGVQVYDADASNIIYQNGCRDTGATASYCKGICVLKSNVLCVGTWLGTVWMFRYELETQEFTYINRVYAHDEAVLLMDGSGNYMASTSTDMSYLWTFRGRDFDIIRKFDISGVMSTPTTLKFKFGFVILGYRSGEFCLFDVNNRELEVRVPAHKLQITGLDVSPKLTILTASDDCYVKVWHYEQDAQAVSLLQTVFNEEGPLYGVGFLNYTATEFAAVTGGSTKVQIYIDWEETNAKIPEMPSKTTIPTFASPIHEEPEENETGDNITEIIY